MDHSSLIQGDNYAVLLRKQRIILALVPLWFVWCSVVLTWDFIWYRELFVYVVSLPIVLVFYDKVLSDKWFYVREDNLLLKSGERIVYPSRLCKARFKLTQSPLSSIYLVTVTNKRIVLGMVMPNVVRPSQYSYVEDFCSFWHKNQEDTKSSEIKHWYFRQLSHVFKYGSFMEVQFSPFGFVRPIQVQSPVYRKILGVSYLQFTSPYNMNLVEKVQLTHPEADQIALLFR